jgi:hypothetical protein
MSENQEATTETAEEPQAQAEATTEPTPEVVEPTPEAPAEKTFTQEELDKILKERLDRAKSRSEKAIEEKDSELAASQEALAEATSTIQSLKNESLAASLGAIDGRQVVALIEGEISEDSIKDFLDDNPHLRAQTKPAMVPVPGNDAPSPKEPVVNLEEIAGMRPVDLAKNPTLLAAALKARSLGN